ncbi:MAG: cytochrome c [Gammaproteobacteria bacterium]|nr:cytochrome c [Gammaproteobacteria bacterium]
MRRMILASFGIAAAAGVALSVWGNATPDRAAYQDPTVVSAGATIYANQCASCHGEDLGGQPDWKTRDAAGYLPAPPHDDSGHTWHHPDAQLFQIVKLGTEAIVGDGYRSNMPGFGEVLSDDDIRAVLAYIKSTWPDRIIDRHNELNAAYDRTN